MQIMDTLKDIGEVIEYLNQGELVTSGRGDLFLCKEERIHHYGNGMHYSLSIDEFRELYAKNSFRLYEETVEIDETKDEAYYRYYRK